MFNLICQTVFNQIGLNHNMLYKIVLNCHLSHIYCLLSKERGNNVLINVGVRLIQDGSSIRMT